MKTRGERKRGAMQSLTTFDTHLDESAKKKRKLSRKSSTASAKSGKVKMPGKHVVKAKKKLLIDVEEANNTPTDDDHHSDEAPASMATPRKVLEKHLERSLLTTNLGRSKSLNLDRSREFAALITKLEQQQATLKDELMITLKDNQVHFESRLLEVISTSVKREVGEATSGLLDRLKIQHEKLHVMIKGLDAYETTIEGSETGRNKSRRWF